MSFYLNRHAQETGEHEVHRATCSWIPDAENRIFLGDFMTSQEAVKEARKYYDNVDGCAFCCPESHNR